ncbi:MAG: putative membrane protein YdfK [Fimbriimonadaceae bacterium]|nr:putative membrane protein YdfK [Fimbriimonadaceae bacterium]
MRRLPCRGTLLNTATVLLGAVVGLVVGRFIPASAQEVALTGLGLVTIGMGIRMFLLSTNVLIVAIAVGLGGALGHLMGISVALAHFAEWARQQVGGGSRFNEALITTSVLYCVGPMTVMGCIQDALENKIELLALKSTMDGIVALFFAAALGPDGVALLVTAVVVLVVQGGITLAAGRLKFLADDPRLLAEMSGAGGPILLAVGFGLANIKKIPTEVFLPALALAPIIAWAFTRFERREAKASS